MSAPIVRALLLAAVSLTAGPRNCFADAPQSAKSADAQKYVPIVAPTAICAAQSDRLGVLILGHRGVADHQLSVVALGSDGLPSPVDPVKVVLPRADALKAMEVYPLSLVLHPKLPLLYVWQDIAAPPPAAEQFDHLVIYRIEGQQLKQVSAFARGTDYTNARIAGALGLDPGGMRLFVPNLKTKAGTAAIGYFDLDDAGLPKPVPVPIQGSLDGQGLEKFQMELRVTLGSGGLDHALPIGSFGLAAHDRDVALFASYSGVGLWDTQNRRGEFAVIYVPGLAISCSIASDPKLPAVYGAAAEAGHNVLFQLQLADGYPTLMPQILRVDEASGFRSPPLVLPGKVNRLAIGGANCVYLVPLDDQGRFAGRLETLKVNNGSVRTMAYSQRHDRLYVPVEKMP